MPAANAALPVIYHKGPVQTYPAIYVVFWQYRNDPTGEAAAMTTFLQSVGGSQWISTVDQYYQKPPLVKIHSHSAELKGVWNDNTNPIPLHPSDTQVQAEAVRLAQHFRHFSVNASYIVATPTGHYTPGFGKQFCAYHGATYVNGMYLPYTNMPYADSGGPCTGAVSPPNYLSVSGHELAETQTDPIPGYGWFDSAGNEIGDKCEGTFASHTFGSLNFYIQALWSNRASGCVQ